MQPDTTKQIDRPDADPSGTGGRKRKRKPASLWAKLLLTLCTLVLVLVVFELTLRVAGVEPTTARVFTFYFEPNTATGWRGKPNISMRFEKAGFSAITSHGPAGFRKTFKPPPPPSSDAASSRQVWVIGDPSTWGWGVEDGKTFVDLLNKTNDELVFRNFGQPGFSSVQEHILMQELLEREQPDLPRMVLILFAENDLGDNMYDQKLNPPRPQYLIDDGRLVLKNFPCKPDAGHRPRAWIKRNSMAYKYLNFHAKRALAGLKNRRATGQSKVPPLPPERHWRVLRHVFGLIKALCDEHGIQLRVIFQNDYELRAGNNPSDALRQRNNDMRDRFVQMCNELHVNAINLTADLRAHVDRGGERLTFPHDGHPTAIGHELIAQTVNAAITKNR